MKLKSLLPSGAWQSFALTCLLGAFATTGKAGLSATQSTRICSTYQDSVPGSPAAPDSLKMLKAYTGTYTIPDDPDLLIILEGGKLYGIPTSGNRHVMIRTGQHQFWVPDKELLLQFEMDSQDRAVSILISKGNISVMAMKKK